MRGRHWPGKHPMTKPTLFLGMSHDANNANGGGTQDGAGRAPGRMTRSGAPGTQGRTTSMVPGRAGSARPTTPQPTAGRMQFRPVIPQRRRTPSAAPAPDGQQSTATPEPKRVPSSAHPQRPRVRPPMEMTASGPFALGPTDKPSSSRAAAAQRPAMAAAPGARPTRPSATSSIAGQAGAGAGDDDEDFSIDIHDVHQLDAAAPQPLLQAPLQFKREKTEVKTETADMEDVEMTPAEATEDVNQAQALDLSESEEEEDEDALASRIVSSIGQGESEGRTFLFQFPRPFPQFRTTQEPVSKADVEGDDDAVVPVDPAPPATHGEIGRLEIYRSGRAVLYVGDIPYDVTSGCETSFLQQVMLLDAEQRHALCLGELSAKMVATPNLSYVLAHAED